MRKRALIHRYDNEPDILSVENNSCSEVYRKSRDLTYEIVIVVPTKRANTNIAVWGYADSPQYTPKEAKPWPGKPDLYPVRVEMKDIKQTTLQKVSNAVTESGTTWSAAWTVNTTDIDIDLL